MFLETGGRPPAFQFSAELGFYHLHLRQSLLASLASFALSPSATASKPPKFLLQCSQDDAIVRLRAAHNLVLLQPSKLI